MCVKNIRVIVGIFLGETETDFSETFWVVWNGKNPTTFPPTTSKNFQNSAEEHAFLHL